MEIDADTRELVARALLEDLGPGDVTAEAVVPEDAQGRATITQKEPGVVFGLDVAAEVFRQTGAGQFESPTEEGEWRDEVPALVASVAGPARALLAAERTALNFLCHLSGVATLTATFVGRVELTGAKVLDTRKTTPGLRALEKYAVRCGGGRNHRFGLDDGILVKDNHLRAAGGVRPAVELLRAAGSGLPIEVEAETLDDVREAIGARADQILLDNMSPALMREAVQLVDGQASLEASGGVSLETVREIAATGVDFVSVGALTHSARSLDVSLELE